MAQSQEVLQRRREKILSRTSNTDEEPESTVSSENSVFQRYKRLKEQENNEKQLIRISRYTGLLILPLSYHMAPWLAYAIVTLLLLFRALWVTRNQVEEPKEPDWLTKAFPQLAQLHKLKYLSRLLLAGKAAFNSLLSFIMAAVLFNAAFIIHKQHLASPQHSEL